MMVTGRSKRKARGACKVCGKCGVTPPTRLIWSFHHLCEMHCNIQFMFMWRAINAVFTECLIKNYSQNRGELSSIVSCTSELLT